MRVLVVEDDHKLAAVIRRGLALEGIAADIATDGEQALVRAEATRYDVVVLDVMLPDGDGFEVCRRLRERGNWAAVLMLTARNTVEDRVRASNSANENGLPR
jgi:two-component system OmpR family response regulator